MNIRSNNYSNKNYITEQEIKEALFNQGIMCHVPIDVERLRQSHTFFRFDPEGKHKNKDASLLVCPYGFYFKDWSTSKEGFKGMRLIWRKENNNE